jgi:hypothetical protein
LALNDEQQLKMNKFQAEKELDKYSTKKERKIN